MRALHGLVVIIMCAGALMATPSASTSASASASVDVPLPDGSGDVTRNVLTADELLSGSATAPVTNAAFAVPENAAPPTHVLEGTLTVSNAASTGGFSALKDPHDYGTLDAVRHLPDFQAKLVQHDGLLIPTERGLHITGNTAWNVALGLGRVWHENGDGDMTRAALPFSLIERNANCVHNGVMTFLFTDTTVSQLRYQVTSETCEYLQFDMWGQLDVALSHQTVPDAAGIRDRADAELAERLPTRPLAQLATDHPNAGVDVAAFGSGITPSALSGVGFVFEGVNYVGACPTRQGDHPYCSEVLLPSYSTAKSAFGTLALLRLAEKYSPSVADELIAAHVPQAAGLAAWNGVTIRHALDMATGNYTSAGYEVDEAGSTMSSFFLAEDETSKTSTALSFPRKSTPGSQWVYHTSDTYLAVQAMDAVLKEHEGPDADIFTMLRDEVLIPAGIGPDALTTLRTDNSTTGAPFGGYGMFWTQDAIAKVAQLFGPQAGVAGDEQLLHPGLLNAAMQRDSGDDGLAIPGSPTMRYNVSVWAKDFDSADHASFTDPFTVPFMSGFGGITVAMMPNGSSYYVFSDNNEFVWAPAVVQSHRLKSMTGGTDPDPDPDPEPEPEPDECVTDGLIGNGGFETGTPSPWTATSTVIDSRSGLQPANSGTWKAWLNGFGWTNTDTLRQSVTVPAGCTDAVLEFWLRIATDETQPYAYDTLTLTAQSDTATSTLQSWSNLDAQEYTVVQVPIGSYAGDSVQFMFTGHEDYSLQTSFVIDDVRIIAE